MIRTLTAAVLAAALLAGCATVPAAPPPDLFADSAFAAPREQMSVDDIFALTPEMRRYARLVAQHRGGMDPRRALFHALYQRDGLQLDYDSERTRTAAEAFAARAGNCLSLAIMTAALAQEMNVPVVLQSVPGEAAWSRAGTLYLNSGHVNLMLGLGNAAWRGPDEYLLVDFLPPTPGKVSRGQGVNRKVVAAMFMNNRAAEALAADDVDEAYWWARNAIVTAPAFPLAYNTLAVVYRRHGDTALAEKALRRALDSQPDEPVVLSNLAQLLDETGRAAEAAPLKARLARVLPVRPFQYYDQGLAALARGDAATARGLFERELRRDPDYHEFHRALALADLALGDAAGAEVHLRRALAASTTRGQQQLYAAKLDRLNRERAAH